MVWNNSDYNTFNCMASILFKEGCICLIRMLSLIRSSESELDVAITLNWLWVILWLMCDWEWSQIALNGGDAR